jgi:trk system potassium uptake protein TrkA
LLGRSLGFGQVVTRIDDPAYEALCLELGLEHTFIPPQTIGRYMADLTTGIEMLKYSAVIRGEARLFLFNAGKDEHDLRIDALDLPDEARVIGVYREGELLFPEPSTRLREGDAALLLCRADALKGLVERFPSSTTA